jgi:hypothetical protein
MSKEWDELISFYQKFESSNEWNIVSMKKLVKLILENRTVNKIHPFTSHHILCLTKYKTYQEWKDKALVSIEPASSSHYWFKFTQPLGNDDFYREKSESISCTFEYALTAYDEMIEKLEKQK